MATNVTDRPKARRGFAAMDPELQRKLASSGGKAAHAAGRAHRFTPEEASAAGRLGGQTHSRERMLELASIGGKALAAKRREAAHAREDQ